MSSIIKRIYRFPRDYGILTCARYYILTDSDYTITHSWLWHQDFCAKNVTRFPGPGQMHSRRPDINTLDSDFARLVRSALAHLYDPAYLQNHPLVPLLELDVNLDQVTRAQGVRRILLECIEALRPEVQDGDRAAAARAYAILTYRFVDGLSMEEIGGKLALSRRQVYREYGKGVKAVASLLWDRVQEARGRRQDARGRMQDTEDKVQEEGTGVELAFLVDRDSAGNRLEAVQAEVDRLRQAGHARESLRLRDVLEGVCNLLAPLAQQTGVQIKMASSGTWPSIVADRVMLRQAFLNLLSHALHTVRRDLAITVSYGRGGVRIDITESPATAETLPVPPSALKPDGVGLAVAQALIEAQGGHFEIQEHEERWQARIALPTSGRATILVVDDNADLVMLFQRYLGGHEVSVVGATDGEQTLRLAAELQPQAITLDVMMPNQDGWEILQRLKGSPDTSHIPVIVCSVLNEPQVARSLGASDTITKPVRQVELLEVLRRWLGPL
jgi:CheY-like chemotaxis protein